MKTKSLLLVILTLGGALIAGTARAGEAPAPVTKAQMQRGKLIFTQICFSCHHIDGRGIPGIYPPLAESDFLLNHRDRAIGVLIHGLRGSVKVNGKTYNNVMPNLNLSNRQIADALTFVSNSFGNDEGAVTEKMVAAKRRALAKAAKQGHPDRQAAQTGPAQGGMMSSMMGGGMMKGGMMGRGNR